MAKQKELQPESKKSGRNADGTFAKGNTIGHNVGQGRPRGVPFKTLLKIIADEEAAGGKTWREILVDKAFRRAIQDGSDAVIIHLMKQLDDEPSRVQLDQFVRIVREVSGIDEDAVLGTNTDVTGDGT